MRLITTIAKIDEAKCTGCTLCKLVCPTLAITMVDRKAKVDAEKCFGCDACIDRCPVPGCVVVEKIPNPRRIGINLRTADMKMIDKICRKAGFHPKTRICYCTGSRADEVAAAILNGARSPSDVSLMTGIRTGCKVECIQPILRLFEAMGIEIPKAPGWQYYGRTATILDISPEVRKKYSNRGFYFDEDEKLMADVAKA